MQPLLDNLAARNSVRLIGPGNAADRAPTIALKTEGSAGELAARLAKKGVNCGGGDFYAVRLLEALGIAPDPGVLRLSFVHYTSAAEIEKVIEALDELL